MSANVAAVILVAAQNWWARNGGNVGILLTALALIFSIWLWLSQRSTKHLDIFIGREQRIQALFSGRLKTHLDGDIVQSPVLITVTFRNTGKRAIAPQDWGDHRTIFAWVPMLMAAELESYSPKIRDLPELRIGHWDGDRPDECQFSQVLLNRGDWFSIQLLVDAGLGQGYPNTTVAGSVADSLELIFTLTDQTREARVWIPTPNQGESSSLNYQKYKPRLLKFWPWRKRNKFTYFQELKEENRRRREPDSL